MSLHDVWDSGIIDHTGLAVDTYVKRLTSVHVDPALKGLYNLN